MHEHTHTQRFFPTTNFSDIKAMQYSETHYFIDFFWGGNIWNYLASKWKIFFLKTIFLSDIMSLAFIGIHSETSLKSQKNNLALWISVYL